MYQKDNQFNHKIGVIFYYQSYFYIHNIFHRIFVKIQKSLLVSDFRKLDQQNDLNYTEKGIVKMYIIDIYIPHVNKQKITFQMAKYSDKNINYTFNLKDYMEFVKQCLLMESCESGKKMIKMHVNQLKINVIRIKINFYVKHIHIKLILLKQEVVRILKLGIIRKFIYVTIINNNVFQWILILLNQDIVTQRQLSLIDGIQIQVHVFFM
ncbi:unnamed protein product [Paramecium pentaurelia]|uniref:Uncharacterized protein n=1 Tax=Paramecium pentaurelia TaxID=43138 RepID=A0A8S1YHH7_9CILI|nr:unnamed protein product [Paramecium pentaurelia]